MTLSPWVGFDNFARFFQDPNFTNIFVNTIVLAVYNIIFFFPIPIILAIMLNEINNVRYKCLMQSFIYMPHFVSWVVVAGICYTLLSNQGGAINEILKVNGVEQINFLGSGNWFRSLIVDLHFILS